MARERRSGEATLGFISTPLLARLLAGAPFAAGWMAAVLVPLVHVIESDVPRGMFTLALTIATIAPVVLYLRRHAMNASVRWDDQTITLLRGGRVSMSIAWRDATVRQRVEATRKRLVQFSDPDGRSFFLATGALFGPNAPLGRVRIGARELDAILAVARERATFVREAASTERSTSRGLFVWLGACLVVSLFASRSSLGWSWISALAFTLACLALLIDPVRRVALAVSRPVAREMLVIDTEERGNLLARRLDGSRVLLDIAAARHPDAMLSSRRGFVSAVLAIPSEGVGKTYRSLEMPIAASFVETRDDRVLRFEQLRAALVDVIGYGAFFATAIAALCFAA